MSYASEIINISLNESRIVCIVSFVICVACATNTSIYYFMLRQVK